MNELTFCILRYNVTFHHLDSKTSRLNEHVCVTDGIYGKRYLILKMNYKINMHLIEFKIAHIKVQAPVYLVLFQKITLGCRIVERYRVLNL